MKLIIDIPEERLNSIKRFGIKQNEVCMLERALISGTPLDDVKLKIEQDMCFDMFNDYGNETAIHKELWEILDNIGKETDA